MNPNRLNSFTDGVIAIIITIMVLELPVPKAPGMAALKPELTLFAAYALSFIKVGIYWSQHHHHAAGVKTGGRTRAARQPLLPVLAEPCPVRRPLGRRCRASRATRSIAFGVIMLLCALSVALLRSALMAANSVDAPIAKLAAGGAGRGMLTIARLRRLDWHRASLAARRRRDLLRRCGDVARPRQEVRTTDGLT